MVSKDEVNPMEIRIKDSVRAILAEMADENGLTTANMMGSSLVTQAALKWKKEREREQGSAAGA